jgi:predicted DNA-binding transcriptional regulator YafY
MPATTGSATSQRLLSLLSLLQSRRDWSAPVLATRLRISERTVRRDIDRLRDLGYAIDASRGPDGGYRLEAGTAIPPLLLDDEQAVAIAITLRTAAGAGIGIEDAASRALATVSRLMPDRLARRIAALEITTTSPDRGPSPDSATTPDALLRIGAAIRAHEQLRFDYRSPSAGEPHEGPPRRIDPHHVLLSDGRWYLIGWSAEREDWRIHRVDRMQLRSHNGGTFVPRVVPGGDPAEFLAARFKGSDAANRWPCVGTVILHLPAQEVQPFIADGTLEYLDADRCRYESGSWSWPALAAQLGRFDADLEIVGPPALADAFASLAARYARASTTLPADGNRRRPDAAAGSA